MSFRVKLILFQLIWLPSCGDASSVQSACISKAEEDTLVVHVENELAYKIRAAIGTTDIGCCSTGEFTAELVDEYGKELKRCGFSDSFGLIEKNNLFPGERVVFRYSVSDLSSLYCGIDISKENIKISYGKESDSRSEYFYKIIPISARCTR